VLVVHVACLWMCLFLFLPLLFVYLRMRMSSNSRFIPCVPFDLVRILRTTLLLRIICMRSWCNWSVSCVAASKTKTKNTQKQDCRKKERRRRKLTARLRLTSSCSLDFETLTSAPLVFPVVTIALLTLLYHVRTFYIARYNSCTTHPSHWQHMYRDTLN